MIKGCIQVVIQRYALIIQRVNQLVSMLLSPWCRFEPILGSETEIAMHNVGRDSMSDPDCDESGSEDEDFVGSLADEKEEDNDKEEDFVGKLSDKKESVSTTSNSKDCVATRKLGLAAYMQINGCRLIKMNGRLFVFETEKELRAWEIEYTNSCCQRHDQAVCELRKLWSN